MPRCVSWVRVLSALSSYLTSAASDLLVILLPALEEQLLVSHHEMEEAHLQEFLLIEDHEQAMVVGIWKGAIVALTAMQLCTTQDFCQVEPGFPDHAGQAKQAELVGDFTIAMATIVAAVNVEDILRGGGQGP